MSFLSRLVSTRTRAGVLNRWSLALIDMRLVASGPTAEVLTPDNLRRTYAGQLEILDEVGRAVAERGRTS